jgi:hypothetical protein
LSIAIAAGDACETLDQRVDAGKAIDRRARGLATANKVNYASSLSRRKYWETRS